MNQIERIGSMEKCLERASEAIIRLSGALEDYADVQDCLKALEAYYGSKEWKQDFHDDEQGLLPPDLKRGVLSEDGIWNLLEDAKAVMERMGELT